MFTLDSSSWLILLLFFFFSICVVVVRRQKLASGEEFLFANRAVPGWLGAIAFAASGVGALELLAMGAAGARYGLAGVWLFGLGSVVAMLACGLVLVPRYRRAGAHSVAEYLGQRYGRGMRVLSAVLLALPAAVGAALALATVARLIQALHLADALFYAFGWSSQSVFTAAILAPSSLVLFYLLLAGLAGAITNQVLQFCVLLGGVTPAVVAGVRSLGGWQGFEAALPLALAGTEPAEPHERWLLLAAGLAVGAAFWCVDMRPLQVALAARSDAEARRLPILAAPLRLFVVVLLVVTGAIALCLPTPQSSTVVREENGIIYHEMKVVPPEVAAGEGAVPARLDTATHKVMHAADGTNLLDYAQAAPMLLCRMLPANLLGLGVAALLAALMSGLAASLSALATLLVHDIYLPFAAKPAKTEPDTKPDEQAYGRRTLLLARWSSAACAIVIAAAAWVLGRFGALVAGNLLDWLLSLIAVGGASLFATVAVAGVVERVRTKAALAGLVTGELAALLHHGLTLFAGATPGVAGGGIAVLHTYGSGLTQCTATALLAVLVNFGVVAVVSWMTPGNGARNAEFAPEISSRRASKLAPKAKAKKKKEAHNGTRPALLAALILGASVLVCLFLR